MQLPISRADIITQMLDQLLEVIPQLTLSESSAEHTTDNPAELVAPRSHDIQLMREAFETLINNLPEDATGFFQQGMSEMDRLNYPDHVRVVMQEYTDQYLVNKVVH
jgi:hypothetical protein